jgi:hypothetical protein
MVIKESSAQHFVIHSKGIRFVFLESPGDFEVGIYMDTPANCLKQNKKQELTASEIQSFKDPNGIDIIIIT